MSKKQVMKRAWELAKNGVKKFGGKVREYFAAALSIAWKEVKSMVKKTKLIGTPKQNKWAKDIIERIREAQPKMKQTCIEIANERSVNEEYLNEALAFIESLDNFPLFKNQSSLYIKVCGFVRTVEDAYELLDKLFYYDDVTATVSKRAKALLQNTYRRINRDMVMGE